MPITQLANPPRPIRSGLGSTPHPDNFLYLAQFEFPRQWLGIIISSVSALAPRSVSILILVPYKWEDRVKESYMSVVGKYGRGFE
jgi:hypothetical protein